MPCSGGPLTPSSDESITFVKEFIVQKDLKGVLAALGPRKLDFLPKKVPSTSFFEQTDCTNYIKSKTQQILYHFSTTSFTRFGL